MAKTIVKVYQGGTGAETASAARTALGAAADAFTQAGAGAVATTVDAKLKETVSVKDFDAQGDDSADDTAAIQAAIDALGSAGTVYFPDGIYKVNDSLVIAAGNSISFRGESRKGTIISSSLGSAAATKYVFKYVGTSGSECQNVTISTMRIDGAYFGYCIYAQYCFPKLVIRDVECFKGYTGGIFLEECWGSSLYDVEVDGDNATSTYGIRIVNANNVCLYNPRIYNMDNDGQATAISATSAECFSIFGGNIENTPRGIHVLVGGTFDGPITIRDVYFEPRAMGAFDTGQPNDHILIEGDSLDKGTALVEGCLFQAGLDAHSHTDAIAYNAVTARSLGSLTLIGNVWQKARYTSGGEGENYFIDCDSTVKQVIEIGNSLVSCTIGITPQTLRIIDSSVRHSFSNNNDDDRDEEQIQFTQTGTGAVVTTVDAKLKEVVSVKDFGAVGDGSNDDTAEIQAALDLAGAIYFPAGTYKVTAGLVMKSDSVIFGAGVDETIIENNTTARYVLKTGDRASGTNTYGLKTNIIVRDLTINGGIASPAGDYAALYFTWFENCHVENVRVHRGDDAGIRFDGYGETFEDGAYLDSDTLADNPLTTTDTSATVTVSHGRHGLNTGSLVTLAGVGSALNGIPALELNAEHSITVVNDDSYTITVSTSATSSGAGGGSSVVASNPRHSTRWSQSKNFSVRNSLAEDSYLGIEVEGGALSGVIEGNRVNDVSYHGIRIPSGEHLVINSNNVNTCRTGIWVDRSKHLNISNNHVVGATEVALPIGILYNGVVENNFLETADATCISDDYMRSAGMEKCIIKETFSTKEISLINSDDVLFLSNWCDFNSSSLGPQLGVDNQNFNVVGDVNVEGSVEFAGGESDYRSSCNSCIYLGAATFDGESGMSGAMIMQSRGDTARPILFATYNGTTLDERMRISAVGGLGLGMSPASTVALDITEPDSAADLIIGLTAGTGGRAQIRSVAQADSTSAEISFLTMASSSTSERMRISASGRVTVKKASNSEVAVLTSSSSTTAISMDAANNFSLALDEDTTLANPSNVTVGQSGVIVITQDSSLLGTMDYGTDWHFEGGTAPTLTATNDAVDTLAYYVAGANSIQAVLLKDMKTTA